MRRQSTTEKAQQRLQKILREAGISSRRGAEELIRAGRVRLNGRPSNGAGHEGGSDSGPHHD